MDEYIKREDALDALMFELAGSGYQSRARDVIRLLPTADVAPRAEVAREIFEEIEREFSGAYWYKGYTIERYIAELKKKYVEPESPKGE